MSATEKQLRELVAGFWKLRPDDVVDELRFSSAGIKGFSSTRFLTFVAAVESNLRVRINDPARMTSYLALRGAVLGGDAAAAAAVERPPVVAAATVSTPRAVDGDADDLELGHDIEEIANLPPTDQVREGFYPNNFSPAEIAWCLSQANPRQHFAVRLCAKEALVKCDRRFADVRYPQLEILGDERGRPTLRVLDETLRRALGGATVRISLSHSDHLASAVVLVSRRRGP